MQDIWKRASETPVAWIGPPPAIMAEPDRRATVVVDIDCDAERAGAGALEQASRRAEQLLGRGDPAAGDAWNSLRLRLGNKTAQLGGAARLVGTLNTLQRHSPLPVVACLRNIERCDADTREALQQILARPGWLRTGLLLCVGDADGEAARACIEAVRRQHGADAIVDGTDARAREAAQVAARAPAHQAVGAPAPGSIDAAVLMTLRACATCGDSFAVDVVAALLDCEPVDVLELVQRAHDLGIAIEDRGDGVLGLPSAFAAELRAQLLPSLAAAWHTRLATILGASDELGRASSRRESGVDAAALDGASFDALDPEDDEPVELSATPPFRAVPAETMGGPETPGPRLADALPETADRRDAADVPSVEELLAAGVVPPRADRAATDGRPGHAARHAEAAGDVDFAAEQYIAACQQAVAAGSYRRAHELAERALALLDGQPASTRRRRVRARALIELGRLQWLGAGPIDDFSLAGALESLDTAAELIDPDDPVELRTDLLTLTAAVCYDTGDDAALERALAALTDASRELADAGRGLEAAALFNDQAAVWVRIGDPVRAYHLLERSREVFARRAAEDPWSRRELAETNHLLARLALHVRARPGREADAIEAGLRHALDAERSYRQLGRDRRLAHVWDTLGRLELRAGHPERALERFLAAIGIHEREGDVLGLAQTIAGLADALGDAGQLPRALDALATSIDLNLEKGSPRGLAYNARALDAITGRAAGADAPGLGQALAELRARLDAAVELIGIAELPESETFVA